MRNRIYIILLPLLILITGCFGETVHKEDLNEKYKDYWNYALGDYSATYEQKNDNGGGSGGLTSNTYRNYRFDYKDKNGISKSFYLSNYHTSFEDIYKGILEEDFEKLLKNRFSKNSKYELKEIFPISIEVKKVDSSIDYYDPKNGVKINELDFYNFYSNNLNILVRIELECLEHYDDYENLKTQLINDFSFVFKDYEYKGITIAFSLREKTDSYNSACYTLGYDGNSYKWDTCYNEKGNYKWSEM